MTKAAPASTAQQLAAFMEALQTGMRPAIERIAANVKAMHTAMRPLIDLYEQHPELFSRPDPELWFGSCHCLCGGHPASEGVCTSYAARGLTMRFDSPTVGVQHVRMCHPCHDARNGVDATASVEVDHITDTCTCHCWVKHPERQGICEAASDSGATVDGKPACLECAAVSC